MLPGVIAHRRTVVPAGNLAIMPFTYDEVDHNGVLTFARQGMGPHQTPSGFEGNGYDARYKATVLPSWLTGSTDPFAMQCSYQGYNQFLADEQCNGGPTPKESFSTIFYLGADSSGATPKCAIGLKADNGKGSRTCVVAQMNGATFTFNRPNWHFQSLTPQYQQSGLTWVPNAILFDDASYLWSCAHLEDTVSRVWETNPSTGALIRSFDYPSPYTHVANFARRASTGDVWFTDSPTSMMGIVDMAASFTAGSAVIPTLMDTTSFNKIGAIDFVTIEGTEYFVAAEYATGGTPYLYVFLASKVGAVTLTAADRVKRWPVGTLIQGLVMKGSQCFIDSNEAGGIVRVYDIATMLTGLADGATPTTIWQEDAPTAYPEDICLHPTTGEFWMPTEGNSTVISDRAHLSFWSSPLNGTCQPSSYTVNYDGTTVTLLHNGKDYFSAALTPATAGCVCIGGPPATAAGRVSGYMYGFASDFALSDTPFTASQAVAIASGSYETRTMTAIQITLTNPGAESGTTGWTVESGTLSQIANTGSSSNLWARTGTNAFGSVSSPGVVASQRVSLTGLGLSNDQLDGGTFWLKPRWWSASLSVDDNRDPGGDGIRLLDDEVAQLSETYSPQFAGQSSNPSAPHYPWNPRSVPIPITAGSRNADLLMKGTRSTDDGSTQCFFDDHELWIFGP